MIKCPICGADMKHNHIHGIEVDECPEHGIWLDKSELLSITEGERHSKPSFVLGDLFRRSQRPPVDRDRTLICPHCGKEMKIEVYEQVHIDWCTEHGVWLDNGELEAILNNLRLDPLYLGKASLRLWDNKY